MLTREEVLEICNAAYEELAAGITKAARASMNDMLHLQDHDADQRAEIERLTARVAELEAAVAELDHGESVSGVGHLEPGSVFDATVERAKQCVNAMDGLRAEWVQEARAAIANSLPRIDKEICFHCPKWNLPIEHCDGCAIRELQTLAQEGE